jgi:hypothetical protein
MAHGNEKKKRKINEAALKECRRVGSEGSGDEENAFSSCPLRTSHEF